MAFKYTKEEYKQLQKAITNYNNKVNRLKKANHPYLPELADIVDIKANINNKWDYNRQIKYLKQFTTRGSEKLITTEGGATLTKYEYDLLEQEQRRLYNKLTYKIKKYGESKPRVFGVEQAETYARMGDEMYENLKARRRNIASRKMHDINKKDLYILRNLVARTSEQYDKGDEGFYNRYIEYILNGASRYWRLNENNIKYIQEKLRGLTPNQFMDMYEKEQVLRVIKEKYDSKHKFPYSETKGEMDELISILAENIDTMVKDYE